MKPDAAHTQHLLVALEALEFAAVGLTASAFERPDQVVQLGGLPVRPVRIDLMTSITSVSWAEAWAGRVPGHYGAHHLLE